MSRRLLLPLLITLAAFAVRVWRLDAVPPGYSDDELSNIFVIAQKIFSGDFAPYYTDATGLEAPYHILSGLLLRPLGFNVAGIRLLSAYLGVLTVPLTYKLGSRLFGPRVGLIASAALSVSFWSLIYSRVNLRHIALPVMALATFYWFLGGVVGRRRESGEWRVETGQPLRSDGPARCWRSDNSQSLISSLLLGLSLYTYFASRGMPLILLAFVVYLALFDRDRLRRRWRGIIVIFGLALLVALPLIVTVQQEAGADARVIEVAVPLVQASQGNFEPLWRHVRVTLSMFHGDGDDEHLYNIPHRPVFGAAGAGFLWLGVAIALWLALQPLRRRLARRPHSPPSHDELAAAFLLLWWAAGIAPGFLSVPPASLGHTILAQPATYLLAALAIRQLARWLGGLRSPRHRDRRTFGATALLGAFFVLGVAARDLPDYFVAWPQQGMVRFLYHADLEEAARYVAREGEPLDFAISGLLAGPWNRLALQLALDNAGLQHARPRWYHAQRAAFLRLAGEPAIAFSGFPRVEWAYEDLYEPLGPRAGAYRLSAVRAPDLEGAPLACFENGLCLQEATVDALPAGSPQTLHLTWRLQAPLQLPEAPLLSKPPPPGVYAGPRLLVFAQRWRGDGGFVAGDDGLWVDPLTVQPGDVFIQQHYLGTEQAQAGEYLLVGLYDPMDGRRILTEDGRAQLRLEISPSDGQ